MKKDGEEKKLFFAFDIEANWLKYPIEKKMIDEKNRHLTLFFLGVINFQNIKSNIHFSDDDDDYILSHSLDESIKLLNRSKRSIQYRISFLKNKLIDS